MTSYSSHQFFEDWRYAVAKEFTTSTGQPFPYAENGKQEWGDEVKKLTFGDNQSPHDGCFSADGKYMAIAVESDIHVIDTQMLDTIAVLKGHISRVSSVAFKTDDSNTLVSSEEGDYGRQEFPVVPTIYVWDIEKQAKQHRDIADEDLIKKASSAAAKAAADNLKGLDVALGDEEMDELEKVIAPAVGRVVRKHGTEGTTALFGRLTTSFQSNVFSPSGAWMAYLPGKRPRSNDKDTWNVAICSTKDEYRTQLTLQGHSDAIMWTGWSPDESVIASVAWDQTIRIWDAATGEEKYKFETDGQNWTGGFSRDSKYFASTCGTGTVQVNDLSDGSTKWSLKLDKSSHWNRALDWHPNGKILAIGGDKKGELLLLDVDTQEVIQHRLLSAEACALDDESVRSFITSWIGTQEVTFVGDGSTLAVWLSGDGSAEVYDLEREKKWRFSRGGTDDGPKSHEWRNEDGKVTSKGGSGMLLGMSGGEGSLRLASIDFDGVRVWSTGSR